MTPIDAIARHGVDLLMPPPQREQRLPTIFHGVGRTPPKKFDRAVWIPLDRADMAAYAGALVRSLRPPMNDRTPSPCGRDAEILARLGLPPHDEATAHSEVRRAQIKARAKRARP